MLNSISTGEVKTSVFVLSAKGCTCHAVWEWHCKASKLIILIVIEVANPHTEYRKFWNIIKSYVSNFYVGMVGEKNGRRHIAIQNVAQIISVVEALYAILTVCLG